MDKVIINNMITDLTKLKEKKDTDTETDISYIIGLMSPYSQKDLYLFRDCIDVALIYNRR